LAIPLLAFGTTAVADSASLFWIPCTVAYNESSPIATDCEVTRNVSGGHVIARVRTRNGKRFLLQNDGSSDNTKWYLNHERVTLTSEQPITCYQNDQVKLCF
jgi:hypothetical protein